MVALGDSYVSGEGARWAGNTDADPTLVDALGPQAYADDGDRESQRGCHRAQESVADVGEGYQGMVLACSGATTESTGSGARFKPGVDFYTGGGDQLGQALALQQFAADHRCPRWY